MMISFKGNAVLKKTEELMSTIPEHTSYLELLTSFYDLHSAPSRLAWRYLASRTSDKELKDQLLFGGRFISWMNLFDYYPGLKGQVEIEKFLELCDFIQPRTFSIASSP